MLNAVQADSSKTVKKLLGFWTNIIPDRVVAEARKRGVADVIACLGKNNEKEDKKIKEDMQRDIKQKNKDTNIFLRVPKMREFEYVTKIEKLEPLLKQNPIRYETLLEKLLVPQVHVGKMDDRQKNDWTKCPPTCKQTISCNQIRQIFEVVKIICNELSKADDIFEGMEKMLIGSMREATRIFHNDELDVHVSLNTKAFQERTSFNTESQTLYLDGEEFNSLAFYTKFLKMVHKIVDDIKLPEDFTMRPLSTDYVPCKTCMKIEGGQAQPYRCRHEPNCEVHHNCQCLDDCACECGCKVYTHPCLTRSKIGAALHFGKKSLNKLGWNCASSSLS